jgi:hypothetical protein
VSPKNKNKIMQSGKLCAFIVYIHESSILAKAYEIKSVVLLGTSLGTHWELDGKLFGT